MRSYTGSCNATSIRDNSNVDSHQSYSEPDPIPRICEVAVNDSQRKKRNQRPYTAAGFHNLQARVCQVNNVSLPENWNPQKEKCHRKEHHSETGPSKQVQYGTGDHGGK